MKRLQKALKGEKGFTLVELMIVIGIIVILASILIAQWSGARKRAYDSQALTVCRNAALAAQIYYNDNDNSYKGIAADKLHDIEASLPDAENPSSGAFVGEYTVGELGSDGQDFQVKVKHTNGTKTYYATKDGVSTTAPTTP
ncbi:MAG TPA: type II secretion system protein [Firmicutes bacterium]|nr:type II secretion system protein [Bacillota bacterium]